MLARTWGRLGLLTRFSLLSLISLIALGLILGHSLEGQLRDRAFADAKKSAELVARVAIQPEISPAELASRPSDAHRDVLDALVAAGRESGLLEKIKVFDRNGRVPYSTETEIVGQTFTPGSKLRSALAGETVVAVPDISHEEHASERGERLVEVLVPLRYTGQGAPAGVIELYLPLAPILDAIAADTRRLYVILATGLVGLYLILLPVVGGASGRLRRQAVANRHQALHDALTGLPNRALLQDRGDQAVRLARREGRRLAVMMIDFDRFKEVNDTLGHRNGDILLQRIAERLSSRLRGSDTIARLGGDEFAILLPDVADAAAAEGVARELRASLDEQFALPNISITTSASIGVALFPEHGYEFDTLLQHADVAMYAAKAGHLGQATYDPIQDRYSADHLVLVEDLRKAVLEGGLHLNYQPKFDMETGRMVGAEALVRWRHPERGLIPPDRFVPLAEHTGLMRPLTRLVLDRALTECRAWSDAGEDLTVAVNLSTTSLLDGTLVADVSTALERAEVPASRLQLEITESTVMADPERAITTLNELREMGVGLSIDDFGTGFSSLTYLKRLPVHEIKIDRSFVMNMHNESEDAAIVRSTIDLGRNLQLRVVAEGIEDAAAWDHLVALGCNVGQGFHLGRPLPAEDLRGRIDEEARAASRRLGSERVSATL